MKEMNDVDMAEARRLKASAAEALANHEQKLGPGWSEAERDKATKAHLAADQAYRDFMDSFPGAIG